MPGNTKRARAQAPIASRRFFLNILQLRLVNVFFKARKGAERDKRTDCPDATDIGQGVTGFLSVCSTYTLHTNLSSESGDGGKLRVVLRPNVHTTKYTTLKWRPHCMIHMREVQVAPGPGWPSSGIRFGTRSSDSGLADARAGVLVCNPL